MGCGFSKSQVDPQADVQGASQAAGPVAQGLGDAEQAVGLIDGVYQLAGPAILKAKDKMDERKSLKNLIGPWWNQAFERGACRVPVLDIDKFEMHLEKTNGVLIPRGSCTVRSPWGYFLHALAVHPEDKILSWKPAIGAPWDMRGGALAMDIRGRVFCHLINFYRVKEPKEEVIIVEDKPQTRTSCQLSFGWLTWTTTNTDHVFATFEADTMPKLNGPKKPMESLGVLLGNKLWESYKAAWVQGNGISDPDLAWPDPKTTPLSKRLQCLITNMERVRDYSDGLILTRDWLSNASRIKARAMTDGSTDNSFLKDAYKILAEHPARRTASEWDNKASQIELESCFFTWKDRFTIIELSDFNQRSLPRSRSVGPKEVLEATLESYNREDPNSWKGQLYAAREIVLEVACMSREVTCTGRGCVRTLDFAEGDLLWEARVHL